MSHVTYRLRWANSVDDDALADVMFDAVRTGRSEYTEAQRRQWVSERRNGAEWTERLARQSIIVAENADHIVGFISLADGGYIDFAYNGPTSQGSGLFRLLYSEIEKQSRADGLSKLWVHSA